MPIPKSLRAPRDIFIEQDVKIKDALADKEQRGLIKRCVCGVMIGRDFEKCGTCLSTEKAQDDAKIIADKMMGKEIRLKHNKGWGKGKIK